MALRAALKGRTITTRKPRAIRAPRKKPRSPHAFTPFKTPTVPPPNSYDPALDAQLRASQRGLADTEADAATGSTRSLSDYLLARGSLIRQRGEGLADLIRSRAVTKENYLADVGNLDRRYSRLGNSQTQATRVAGGSSGVLAQALRKRTANRALEKQPLDVNLSRANTASNIAQTRLVGESDRQAGALGVQYQRGVQDRTTDVARAQREGKFFGTDVSAERFFQARATGYTPPKPPAGEYARHGLVYRVDAKRPARKRIYTVPSGRRFNRADWLTHLRRRRHA